MAQHIARWRHTIETGAYVNPAVRLGDKMVKSNLNMFSSVSEFPSSLIR